MSHLSLFRTLLIGLLCSQMAWGVSLQNRVDTKTFQEVILPKIEKTHHDVSQALKGLINDVGSNAFSVEGTTALQDYFNVVSGKGANFKILRQVVLTTTNNEGIKIPARIHEREKDKLAYINQMLRETAGIDFLEYVAVIDNSLPDPTQPLAEDKRNYDIWRYTRLGVMISLGWLSIIINEMGTDFISGVATFDIQKAIDAINLNSMKALSIWAVTVSILEAQFALFNNWWNDRAWSKSYPLKIKAPKFTSKGNPLYATLKQSMNALFYVTKPVHKPINKFAEKTKVLTQGLSYVYLVNITYQTLGFMTVNLGFYLMGMPMPNPSFLSMLANGIMFSLAFDATVGITQLILGRQQRLGKLSEPMRSKLEFIAIKFGNLARFMAPIPQTQAIAMGVYGVLGAVTLALPVGNLVREKLSLKKIRLKFKENTNANSGANGLAALAPSRQCRSLFAKQRSRVLDASVTRLPQLFKRMIKR